jgi:hypothetical protein
LVSQSLDDETVCVWRWENDGTFEGKKYEGECSVEGTKCICPLQAGLKEREITGPGPDYDDHAAWARADNS